jgi:hypothetical protein
MTADRLDTIRQSVLTRMERAERNMRLGIYGAALTELLLFVIAFKLVDFSDRLERLLFVLSILSYTIIVLGLVALGAHVTRSVGRLAALVDAADRAP